MPEPYRYFTVAHQKGYEIRKTLGEVTEYLSRAEVKLSRKDVSHIIDRLAALELGEFIVLTSFQQDITIVRTKLLGHQDYSV